MSWMTCSIRSMQPYRACLPGVLHQVLSMLGEEGSSGVPECAGAAVAGVEVRG